MRETPPQVRRATSCSESDLISSLALPPPLPAVSLHILPRRRHQGLSPPSPGHPPASNAEYDPNDGNRWGPRSGQDFRANHAHPDIDYAVMHLWPDK